MTEGYRWVKWRTRHAHGPGSWQWSEMPVWGDDTPLSKQLQSFLNEKGEEEYSGSDKYRGVEGDFENPPLEVLQKRIADAEKEIEHLNEAMVRWTAQQLEFC